VSAARAATAAGACGEEIMNEAYLRRIDRRASYLRWREKWVDEDSLLVWPYNERAASETEAMCEPLTEAQSKYIHSLSEKHSEARAILDSVSEGVEVEALTKGQAMYVIKCLLYEITPQLITPSMLNQIYKQEGVYWQ
jgi:hypothetical protein